MISFINAFSNKLNSEIHSDFKRNFSEIHVDKTRVLLPEKPKNRRDRTEKIILSN